MATELDHITLANKNNAALLYLAKKHTEYPEWISTVAFYKALQIVEASFVAHSGVGCHDHPSRLRRLREAPYQSMYKHFRVLWSASTVARYLYDNQSQNKYASFEDFMPADKVLKMLVCRRLLPLEGIAVQHFLSDKGKEALKKVHKPSLPIN